MPVMVVMVVDGSMKSIEIFFNYNCNYNCNFCFEFDSEKSLWYSKEEIISHIEKWFKSWARHIIFSWWEPTLEKNLFFYIKYSKNLWYKRIWIHTNWFKLSDNKYLNQLYDNGLTWVVLSIHWLYKINDLITWIPWSFEKMNKALINLSKLKKKINDFNIDTNTVICRQNRYILDKIFLYLLKFPITKRLFSFPNSSEFLKASDYQKRIMKDFMVRYSEVKDKLFFINKIREKRNLNDVMLEWIPFCMVDDKLYWFLLWWKKQWDKMLFTKDLYFWENDKDYSYIKYDECNNCKLYSNCYGFSKDYIAYYWKTNFKSII